jgi:hypothetical protein
MLPPLPLKANSFWSDYKRSKRTHRDVVVKNEHDWRGVRQMALPPPGEKGFHGNQPRACKAGSPKAATSSYKG